MIPQAARGVFSLALQQAKAITERDYQAPTLPAKAVALQSEPLVEGTALQSWPAGAFENIYVVQDRDVPCPTMERLSTDLVVVFE